MKVFLTLVFALLLAGCIGPDTKPRHAAKSSDCPVLSFTTQGIVCLSEPAIWLEECVKEMVCYQSNKERWFNGMGSNDAVFIPKADFAQEIFQKCISVKPLSTEKVFIYKRWLEDRILEIRGITAGMTRKQVDQIMYINGGLCTPSAAIYSHIECSVLKVRIEFEPVSNEHKGYESWADDKVKAVSTPYLGVFIND